MGDNLFYVGLIAAAAGAAFLIPGVLLLNRKRTTKAKKVIGIACVIISLPFLVIAYLALDFSSFISELK